MGGLSTGIGGCTAATSWEGAAHSVRGHPTRGKAVLPEMSVTSSTGTTLSFPNSSHVSPLG